MWRIYHVKSFFFFNKTPIYFRLFHQFFFFFFLEKHILMKNKPNILAPFLTFLLISVFLLKNSDYIEVRYSMLSYVLKLEMHFIFPA